MSEPAEVLVILALMEATGQDEIRLTDEALTRVDPRTHLMTYRDDMRSEQVFRRVTVPDVIDGEEVPAPALAIEGRS